MRRSFVRMSLFVFMLLLSLSAAAQESKMIHNIVRIGTPSLREPSVDVTPEQIQDPAFQALIDDMIETMHHLNGVGIAAPQIGHNIRVVVIEVTKSLRYPEAGPIPLTVLINPRVEPLSDAMEEAYEGCLSVGDLRGSVPRYLGVRYQGLDRTGKPIEGEARGFFAKVMQHELDHIDGRLYIDRVKDTRSLGFTQELELAGKIPPLPRS